MGIFTRKKDRGARPSIEEHVAQGAKAFVAGVARHDRAMAKQLDYTRGSLEQVDEFLADVAMVHRLSGTQPDETMLDMCGTYVLETARREYGGHYEHMDETNPYVLVIGEPQFRLGFCAMGKVRGRLEDEGDNIPFFYDGLAPLVEQQQNATLV